MSKTVAGALVGQALGSFGKKPYIPDLPTLDVGQEQRLSVADNLAALPSLENLAGKTNRFNFAEISRMLEAAVPGFGSALKTAGTNAASLARGEIPEDVARAVQGTSAAHALGGGYAGSGFGFNRTARDLGLTSLNLTGEGQNRLMSLGGFARNAFPTFDFTNAFITPQQRLSFDWTQNLAQYQVRLMQEQVKAAPDPAMAELGQAFDNFFETWKNVGMGALGGVGGMGGGGGGGGSMLSGMMGGGGSGGGGSAPAYKPNDYRYYDSGGF